MTRAKRPRAACGTARQAALWLLLGNALLALLAGCGEDEVRAYRAPKAEPYVEPQLFTAAPQPQADVDVRWTVPNGWAESPNSSDILFVVFEAKSDAGDARITVTKLGTDGGGVLANINRWRGQVGLAPISKIEQQEMTTLQADGRPVGLIDMAAPEGLETNLERLIVVLMPRPEQGLTWYFKMTGPAAALDGQKAAFVGFVESVSFEAGGETTPENGGQAGE